MTKNSRQIDLLAMNVTWFPKDFEVYDNQVGIVEATILTIVKGQLISECLLGVIGFPKNQQEI